MNLDQAEQKVNKLIKDGFRAGWMKDFLKYKKENDIDQRHQKELELLVEIYLE